MSCKWCYVAKKKGCCLVEGLCQMLCTSVETWPLGLYRTWSLVAVKKWGPGMRVWVIEFREVRRGSWREWEHEDSEHITSCKAGGQCVIISRDPSTCVFPWQPVLTHLCILSSWFLSVVPDRGFNSSRYLGSSALRFPSFTHSLTYQSQGPLWTLSKQT